MHGWLFKLMQFQAAGEQELKHTGGKKTNKKRPADCVDRCRSDESYSREMNTFKSIGFKTELVCEKSQSKAKL